MTNLTNAREQPASQSESQPLSANLILPAATKGEEATTTEERSDCDCTCALFDRTMLPLSLAEWGINTVVVVVTLIIIWWPSGMCSAHRLY